MRRAFNRAYAETRDKATALRRLDQMQEFYAQSAERRDAANDQMAAARKAVNSVVGERRLLTHAVLGPGQDGWLDEVDRVHEILKPDGWKGYTVGEPFSPSFKRYRLDDEALML